MWTPDEACRNLLVGLLSEMLLPPRLFWPELNGLALNIPDWSEVSPERMQRAIRDGLDQRLIYESASGDLGLTPAGGNLWQTFSAPRWHLCWQEESDETTTILMACERTRLESLLAIGYPWQVRGPIRWRRLTPFPALYWKTLPTGWQAEFASEMQYGSDESLVQRYSAAAKWYHRPWTHPDWPFARRPQN
jgi:hypothetical protein